MDAPIGYSGAPYIPRVRHAVLQIPNSTAKPAIRPLNFDLHQFPLEILHLIASSLSQFDILSLVLVDKEFHRVFLPLLYRNVTIDHKFSQFNNHEIPLVSTTFIKTSYSVKLFFKRLIAHRETLCGLIQRLECAQLPAEILQFQLRALLAQIFPYLTGLKLLIWYNSNELDFKLVLQLPCVLQKLHLNTKIADKWPVEGIPMPQLTSLHSFAVVPLQNSSKLRSVASLVQFSQLLRELRVARLFNKESILVPPANSLVTSEDILDLDVHAVSLMFSRNKTQLKLRKLSIDGVLVQPRDFQVLVSNVDLAQLQLLDLSNVTEVVKIDPANMNMLLNLTSPLDRDSQAALRALIEPNLITSLAQPGLLRNLKSLKIDIRQGYVDSGPGLISSLPGLAHLDIICRWNQTKQFAFPDFDLLIGQFVDSILCQSPTLVTLAFELRLESVLVMENEDLYTLPKRYLVKLLSSSYPNLTGLRLNAKSEDVITERRLLEKHRFPQLQFLNLFGNGVYNKHMAMGVVNRGILDDYFKIQHVVINLLDGLDTEIKYVMIDLDKVFEIKYDLESGRMVNLEPREGISGWFTSNVRVDFFK